MSLFKIALIEPEIPWNTGNVGRTCLGMGGELHLVGRLGFSLEDRFVKRAGLDYWAQVPLLVEPDVEAYFAARPREEFFFFSKKAVPLFWDARFFPGSTLVFGSETSGLPSFLFQRYPDRFYRIPLAGPIRSLNLSTAVGIALSEALRQVHLGRGTLIQNDDHYHGGKEKSVPNPERF